MTYAPLSVAVYCGSRDGADPAYANGAEALGTAMAEDGMKLVYGAGDVGLMGRVARAHQAAGGAALGVIPEHLLRREVGKSDLSQFIVTETMHERKKVMFMNADAVVVMPGGAGSLDEFFEVLTWRQLDLHHKPIILMNIKGYWDKLNDLIDHVITEGFAEVSLRNGLQVARSTEDVLAALRDLRSDSSAETE
ncbi:TIGR00730 family Rossman fold protein [Alphaproteobacteria bacterium KMM 3653]|uniref:Cytokinin riboside 5'-monophosphate phosphoribohydrolase n=1 Tax=Harenicola maris TaxID=2841044 RepID=A0AAP2G3G7_9RHOB|nr:TIGR00730 family Rossman fold protein [Harenicola maris]